ncbi:hypothetical protein ACIA8R_43070 [Nonomuraea sp. NPDC051191]|uniref:hypothetical protein n=1 Tax=Nonomuraea sp. NPDC051191 TaxID=3364372 RepID=UPI0037A873B2
MTWSYGCAAGPASTSSPTNSGTPTPPGSCAGAPAWTICPATPPSSPLWRVNGVEIELFIGQVGELLPTIRINRTYDDGRRLTRDLDLQLATELADILDTLNGRGRELAAALRTAAETLRPVSRRSGKSPTLPVPGSPRGTGPVRSFGWWTR